MKKMMFILVWFLFGIFFLDAENIIINEKVGTDSVSIKKIKMLEFGAEGCYSCVKMEKVMEEIRKEYSDYIDIIFIDCRKSENLKIKDEYFIKYIPSQVFINEDGEIFERHVGFLAKEKIEKIIKDKFNLNEKNSSEHK